MATPERPKSARLEVNGMCPVDREINILLLGQTGVGKTTFINSLANYLIYDTIDDAIGGEMEVIIPSTFSVTDPETSEEKIITIGKPTEDEEVIANGQSCTQQCQSYVFPMGDQNLRLIDTPGLGDTRGCEQDNKNLFEILTYISYYEHLNGICILLRPNEERLTIAFRLFIKQLLHHLHITASQHIIFLFTNARSTFFTPGSSRKLLKRILDEYRDTTDVEVPLAKENTFLLDNETFRYLALHQNDISFNDQYAEAYRKSWDFTVKEYERLITYISSRSLLAIQDTLSLNEAEQLIRKLARPIAETIRLTEQNMQLAEEYKQIVINRKHKNLSKLSQNSVNTKRLRHPKLVCASGKCSIINNNAEKIDEYFRVCQEESYLNGVIQETIRDPKMKQCRVIDSETGKILKIFFLPFKVDERVLKNLLVNDR
jgi:GTPase SAR1 family protein